MATEHDIELQWVMVNSECNHAANNILPKIEELQRQVEAGELESEEDFDKDLDMLGMLVDGAWHLNDNVSVYWSEEDSESPDHELAFMVENLVGDVLPQEISDTAYEIAKPWFESVKREVDKIYQMLEN